MHETYEHASYIDVFTHFTRKYNYEEYQYSTFSFMVYCVMETTWLEHGKNMDLLSLVESFHLHE